MDPMLTLAWMHTKSYSDLAALALVLCQPTEADIHVCRTRSVIARCTTETSNCDLQHRQSWHAR
jgi:hypothetical protein